ncbi:MAG: hypothetical protein AAF984_07650 [Verrucomicrobiota bacterium]
MTLYLVFTSILAAEIVMKVDDSHLILEDKNQTITIPQGAISRRVIINNQLFRLSYGKDTQNRTMIICYADPESPKRFGFKYAEKKIKLSSDAALTILIDAESGDTIFKPGTIGTVKINNQILTERALRVSHETLKRSNKIKTAEQIVPSSLSIEQAVTTTTERKISPPVSLKEVLQASKFIRNKHPSHLPFLAKKQGTVTVRNKNSTKPLQIEEQSKFKMGSTIETGIDGIAYVVFSPQCALCLMQNSSLTIYENGMDPIAEISDTLVQLNQGACVVMTDGQSQPSNSLRVTLRESPSMLQTNHSEFYIYQDSEDWFAKIVKGKVKVISAANSTTILADQVIDINKSAIDKAQLIPKELNSKMQHFLKKLRFFVFNNKSFPLPNP